MTLGSIGGERAMPALLTAIKQHPSPQVRWRTAMALSGPEDTSVLPDLESLLQTERDGQALDSLEKAIAKLGGN